MEATPPRKEDAPAPAQKDSAPPEKPAGKAPENERKPEEKKRAGEDKEPKEEKLKEPKGETKETKEEPEPPEESLPYWQRGRDEGGFKRLLFLVTIVALVIMIIAASYGLARINRTFGARPSHLYFDAVYVRLDANVTFDIYLTNDGETDSGSLELIVHALKAAAGTQVIGGEASLRDLSVPKKSTQPFSATVALSHDSYDVRIDLFEDGRLLLQKKMYLTV